MEERCLVAAKAGENPGQGIGAENLFPLEAPEPVVCLQRRGRILRHTFRTLTAADDRAFLENLSMDLGDGYAPGSAISDEANLALYRSVIVSVDGYRTRDGRRPEEFPCWPEFIPVDHRLAAVAALLKNKGLILMSTVRVASDGRVVLFAITRGGVGTGEAIRQFVVAHNFQAPTAEHARQFSEALEPTPSSWTVLLTLYDTLIEGVEGYSIGGRALSGRDEAVREMFTYHKGFAVTILLSQFLDRDPETLKRRTAAIPTEFSRSRRPAQPTCAEVN